MLQGERSQSRKKNSNHIIVHEKQNRDMSDEAKMRYKVITEEALDEEFRVFKNQQDGFLEKRQ